MGSITASEIPTPHYDAIVIGAGFAGLYMLHKLRNEQGLNVRAFDKAGGVGGTWYWNRYPGALSDTETYLYCYSFDKDLLRDWNWNTRYVNQPQILSYLEHVTDRFDLRRSIQFNTGITGAYFDEATHLWHVKTDTGEAFTARFMVTALGLLSATNLPNIKGRDSFKGELHHTGAFPKDAQFAGKRVGVIGTGSTGLQVNTAIAGQVAHLTVFQRSPQYSVPVGNGPVDAAEVAEVKANYDQIWSDVRASMVAFGFKESTIATMSVSPEKREEIFEKAWQDGGGFRYMFATFNDIAINAEANEEACKFIRRKIASIVKDPETARKLTPTDYYARRPLCDGGYYEIFNQDNVALVDIKANPIDEITPEGIRTADGVLHELDMIIFATGFDAVDGSYVKLDLRGRNGVTIQDHWKNGPTSYLGMTVTGFPNMFMVLGPYGPFTNLPPSIETQVEWISDTIRDVLKSGKTLAEATPAAETSWVSHCNDIAKDSLFSKVDSWIFGANIPGKTNTLMFYFGGIGGYRQELHKVTSGQYEGFSLESVAGP